MAPPPPPSSSSSSSSRASPSRPPPSHQSPHFTPIQECEREELDDEVTPSSGTDKGDPSRHHPTPIHKSDKSHGKQSTRTRTDSGSLSEDDRTVSCNKCRPSSREKISVVPLDNNAGMNRQSSSLASPNGIFKSILASFTRKSPRTSDTSWTAKEEHWKIAVTELSHKLIQATRKRDEALLEASRLKYSMAELEKKLNKLEVYCHNLKSGLDVCSGSSPYRPRKDQQIEASHFKIRDHDKVIEHFLVAVSESRSSIRLLSRSLTLQLRQIGGKVYERISLLLQPYDVKISFSKNPRALLFYLEAFLSKAFFEDFESVGFQKSASNHILNPIERCEANYASFNILQGLTWEEVLNKGTRHFSEEFSRFCDRKMSEIVAMLAWNRAWTEPLLQAFFAASKSVWLVHLLATSVHPGLPIFRVETGTKYDSVYMEDMGGDKARRLVPAMVRVMVAPGFYVYGNVVKCKVLCRYSNDATSNSNNQDKGVPLTPTISLK